MKNYKLHLLILIGLFNQYLIGQEIKLTSKDSIVESSWIIGLGINIVDDSGNSFNSVFAGGDEWNAVSHPSRLSIGKYFKNGLGIEAIGTYNKYKVGKIIDGAINTEEIDYLGFDARLTYDLNKILGETGFFDPYVGIGAGYTDANNIGRGTYNAVIGFRAWFSDRWGVDLNSTGKWSMGNEASNHIQHAAGVVYQFEMQKALSKKGLEKLALIQELEKENQRVQDSIAAVKEAEELAKALADKLQKEKEAALLAKAEKEALILKRKNLEDALTAIGDVYFNFNSSYLNSNSKAVLDNLVLFIDDNPSLVISVTSHTDSRGKDSYNKWLSERRVKKTIDYLITKGLMDKNMTFEGFGEEQLVNDCDDSKYCSEKEHKLNRRSEFKIVKF